MRPLLCPALVGRESQTAQLLQEAALAESGRGRLVILEGEAGAGKSRLAAEIARTLAEKGWATVAGRCSPRGSQFPYEPLVLALRRLLADFTAEEWQAAAGPLWADLSYLLPELGTPESPAGGGASPVGHRLYEAVSRILRASASRSPVIITLEDMHWSDAGSLELLNYLVWAMERSRLLLVLTLRPDEPGDREALRATLAGWWRERLGTVVRVGALQPEELRRMVQETLGPDAAISEPFLAALAGWSEGNPFLIEELLTTLAENGTLVFHGGRWEGSVPERPVVPDSLLAMLEERLRRLTPQAAEVLEAAAVLGPELPAQSLQALSSGSGEVSLSVTELIRQGLLQPAPGGQVRFRHALLHEAIYRALPAPRRQSLHRQAAALLEARGVGSPLERTGALAHHHQEAGDWERAAEYLLKAGEIAERLPSYGDAIRFARRALSLLPEDDPRRRTAEWLLARSLYWRGACEEAVPLLESLRAGAANAVEEANVLLLLALAESVRLRLQQARQYLDAAIGLQANLPYSGERLTQLQYAVCSIGTMRCDLVWMRDTLRLLLEEAERAGDRGPAVTATTLSLAQAHVLLGEIRTGRELAESVKPGRDASLADLSWYRLGMGAAADRIGDYATALQHYESLIKAAEPSGSALVLAYCMSHRARVLTSLGRWAEAEDGFRGSVQVFRQLASTTFAHAYPLTYWARLERYRGRTEAARSLLNEAMERADAHIHSHATAELAQVLIATNDPAAALRALHPEIAATEAASYRYGLLQLLLAQARAHLALDDGPGARTAAERAHELAGAMECKPGEADALFLLAREAATRAPDQAWRLLQTVLEAPITAERPYERALAQLEAASLLIRHPDLAGAGGREAAERLVEAAAATAATLDSQPLRLAVQQITRRLPASKPAPASGPLTRREEELLPLVAAGLSNRQIAQRLHITEKTVESHIGHILAKLGLSTRAQIAVWAARAGLAGDP